VLTEMDATDSFVFSICNACCIIQLLSHMVSLQHIPLQLLSYGTLSWLDSELLFKESGFWGFIFSVSGVSSGGGLTRSGDFGYIIG
jgi:hypothetical protein